MRTNLGEQRRAFPPGIKSLSEQGRNQILRHGRPGAVDPLTAVVRVFSDNALAPALDTIGLHGDEKNATVVEAVKTRLEKVDERQMDFTQRDGFDFHAQVLKVSRFQSFKTLALEYYVTFNKARRTRRCTREFLRVPFWFCGLRFIG